MSRLSRHAIVKAAAVCLATLLAQGMLHTPARAQGLGGLLADLFSKPEPPAARFSGPQPAFHRLPPALSRPGEAVLSAPRPKPVPHAQAAGLGGGLRTMCVRICDGYYWPLTYDASRGRLARDSKVCQSSCGAEARLFSMPISGEARDMVDLSGRPYTKLPNAFRYRKGEVADCRCRPEAWAESERERHQSYAAQAAGRKEPAAEQPATMAMIGEMTEKPTPAPGQRQALAELETIALAGALVPAAAGKPDLIAAGPSAAPVAVAEIVPSTGAERSTTSGEEIQPPLTLAGAVSASPVTRPAARRSPAAPPPYDVARLHGVPRTAPARQQTPSRSGQVALQSSLVPTRASYQSPPYPPRSGLRGKVYRPY